MSILVTLLILVIVLGLLLYAVQLLPLQPPLKAIAQVILILICVVVLLEMTGVLHLRAR